MTVRSIEHRIFPVPVSTVTAMLADVDDLTSVWEFTSDERAVAATRHAELLSAIVRHGGLPVEQSECVGFVATFTRASAALAAALDIQRIYHAERWPSSIALRLRVALHTAEAQLDDEGHCMRQVVDRCARLRAVAHGGQVVLSQATRDLVLNRLPRGSELADLGVHRLHDLGRPEHVFGLLHPDLPGDFAPLRSLDVLPNNLPCELTSFVGRYAELAQLRELLGRVRLLTLTGAGGCGKTRLALQAAAEALDVYPDGVWWVEVVPTDGPRPLPASLIDALRLREVPGQRLFDTLARHLRQHRALVVLNNCEQLLVACAQFTDDLLRACPSLTVLATSRAPLSVPGETTWRVPSMTLPAQPRHEPIEALGQFDVVRLFLDRAMLANPSFVITEANAPAVVRICRDLDGIPLAIELAAARVRMLTPKQIADGLSDRFHLLTGGSRMVMPRYQTLWASIDWSHELLGRDERALLRRLSVFVSGWTLDAAQEVSAGDGIDRRAVLNLLTELVDASLVTTTEEGAEVRYGLLETVRHYAATKLAEAGEADAMGDRHLGYYIALAESVERELLGAGQNNPVLHQLTDEILNLCAALEWAANTDPPAALRLAVALSLFWLFTRRYQEGDAAYARALDSAGQEPTPLRGRVLWGRATLAFYAGAHDKARDWAQVALETFRRSDSGLMQAPVERLLGRLALAEGDTAEAERYVHDALGHLGTKGFAIDIPECLDTLAAITAKQEHFKEVARLLGAAAAAREQLGIVRFPAEPEFWSDVENATRGALGGAYEAAFAAGRSLSMEAAVGYARRARGERKRPSRGWESLTPTELEIVRHVAVGRTNPQIGERMFISRGTVKVHLSHIFAKLGITSRFHLATEATRRGLNLPGTTTAASR